MGTDWGYKRNRTATAEEIADTIHAGVTIQDALRLYCPSTEIRHHRCPCPIHNGKDLNFSFTDQGYRCFVCGASGDVINLVKDVLGYSTRSAAMQRICEDFHLPVAFNAPLNAETSEKVKRLREEAERKRREKEEWEEKYHKALDEWIELDKVVINTPWDSEENIRRIVEAKEKRARAGYHLDLILAQEPR